MANRVKSSRRGPAPAKARNSSRQAAISSAGGPRGLLAHQGHDAVHDVFVALVAGFRKAVGVEEEGVADLQLQARGGELAFAEHPQWQTGGLDAQHAAVPDDDCGPVAGVMDFHLPGRFSLAAHQRGVLPGQRAFTEDAIGAGDHLAERQGHTGQAAKQGVELRH